MEFVVIRAKILFFCLSLSCTAKIDIFLQLDVHSSECYYLEEQIKLFFQKWLLVVKSDTIAICFNFRFKDLLLTDSIQI